MEVNPSSLRTRHQRGTLWQIDNSLMPMTLDAAKPSIGVLDHPRRALMFRVSTDGNVPAFAVCEYDGFRLSELLKGYCNSDVGDAAEDQADEDSEHEGDGLASMVKDKHLASMFADIMVQSESEPEDEIGEAAADPIDKPAADPMYKPAEGLCTYLYI